MDKDAQTMLKLIVLDWDVTNGKRPIAEVELSLAAGNEGEVVNEAAGNDGEVVTRKLDLKDCGGCNAVQRFAVNYFPKIVGDLLIGR